MPSLETNEPLTEKKPPVLTEKIHQIFQKAQDRIRTKISELQKQLIDQERRFSAHQAQYSAIKEQGRLPDYAIQVENQDQFPGLGLKDEPITMDLIETKAEAMAEATMNDLRSIDNSTNTKNNKETLVEKIRAQIVFILKLRAIQQIPKENPDINMDEYHHLRPLMIANLVCTDSAATDKQKVPAQKPRVDPAFAQAVLADPKPYVQDPFSLNPESLKSSSLLARALTKASGKVQQRIFDLLKRNPKTAANTMLLLSLFIATPNLSNAAARTETAQTTIHDAQKAPEVPEQEQTSSPKQKVITDLIKMGLDQALQEKHFTLRQLTERYKQGFRLTKQYYKYSQVIALKLEKVNNNPDNTEILIHWVNVDPDQVPNSGSRNPSENDSQASETKDSKKQKPNLTKHVLAWKKLLKKYKFTFNGIDNYSDLYQTTELIANLGFIINSDEDDSLNKIKSTYLESKIGTADQTLNFSYFDPGNLQNIDSKAHPIIYREVRVKGSKATIELLQLNQKDENYESKTIEITKENQDSIQIKINNEDSFKIEQKEMQDIQNIGDIFKHKNPVNNL
ncbi:MAG: hypothetical protein GF332_03940 [Candidatus Moranbacteria bacterium]|nr:hypothetical protein [Candidatus Moranbacteria bacterium]